MLEFQQEALLLLEIILLPDFKDALILMVNYVMKEK
jgi:hypothetical protein